MLPNLLGQNQYWGMTEEKLAQVLSLSRGTVHKKLLYDNWTLEESLVLSALYRKPIEWLFASEEQINEVMGFPDPALEPKVPPQKASRAADASFLYARFRQLIHQRFPLGAAR